MLELIIVLGNSNNSIMQKRLDRAIIEFNKILYTNFEYEYTRFQKSRKFIVSGTITEVIFMKSYLNEKGICDLFIITEDKSSNTIENIQNSIRLVENLLLVPASIIICTSTFHIGRTIVIAGMFMNKYNVITRYIHTNEICSTNEIIREQSLINSLLEWYIKTRCN